MARRLLIAGEAMMPDLSRAGRMNRSATRGAAALSVSLLALLLPPDARASLLSPELEDKLATFIALFVLFVVPCVLIVLFWLVHILPEKIAHTRHHPQFEAIRTLCLLSLVFGGLLWPFAWLWAYSKPVFYKMAYGTDTALDHDPRAMPADDHAVRVATLRDRIARLEERVPPSELQPLRADLDALEAKFAPQEAR
jgi:CBS domain containing-hemolysin-like protein